MISGGLRDRIASSSAVAEAATALGLQHVGSTPDSSTLGGSASDGASGATEAAGSPPDAARLLDDLAKVLQETAHKAALMSHIPIEPNEPDTAPIDDDGGMPKILTAGERGRRPGGQSGWSTLAGPGWLRRQRQMTPLALATTVGLATLVVLGGINAIVGYQSGGRADIAAPTAAGAAGLVLDVRSEGDGRRSLAAVSADALPAPAADETAVVPAAATMVAITAPPMPDRAATGQETASGVVSAGGARTDTVVAERGTTASGAAELGAGELGAAAPAAVVTTRQTDESLLNTSARLIEAGDIQRAREGLARAASGGDQMARFALAETYDPNMLAAWGLRSQVADVNVARTLYQQALQAGDERARKRIDALAQGR